MADKKCSNVWVEEDGYCTWCGQNHFQPEANDEVGRKHPKLLDRPAPDKVVAAASKTLRQHPFVPVWHEGLGNHSALDPH